METVIAECQDLISAERSVRWLETQGISIQNVSIVDEAKRIWRKSHPAWAHPSRAKRARARSKRAIPRVGKTRRAVHLMQPDLETDGGGHDAQSR
jgi:hypothetical protein